MEDRTESSSDVSDAPCRRRGRPMGKNRVPLSINERRARNAQYERERRIETSEAMAELAEAARCDTNLSNCDLLATVIKQLQRAAQFDSTRDIEELRRSNAKLIKEVEDLEKRLSNLENNKRSKDVEKDTLIVGKRKRKSNRREKSAKFMKSSEDFFLNTESNMKISRNSTDAEEELVV
ncbi:uncharacterized protein LOC112044327 [Bicyclus anynana]|uniref:Uncharacterized protein LOC112044327 n=1 Tax=Bicyclus anynana TaxID=110368 RepID=A0ABM3LYC0_BICAN|nr:uncharacterized protein LOC112044327 [Bicyclus anynana]